MFQKNTLVLNGLKYTLNITAYIFHLIVVQKCTDSFVQTQLDLYCQERSEILVFCCSFVMEHECFPTFTCVRSVKAVEQTRVCVCFGGATEAVCECDTLLLYGAGAGGI